MSNSTISALSSASTPLSGSEILPLNQSGVTNSVSVANLTAGRAVSGLSFAAATIGAPASTTLSIQANGTTYATILGAGTNNGYFGIGITSPVAQLHVVSASGGTTARFKNSGSGNFIDFYGSSRQGYVGCVDGTNFWVHSDSATGSIYFDTNNTTQATLNSSGNFLLATGNLVPSTAGKGINFTANTPASGMTSQNLTWYEQGTWTPSDSSGASLSFTQNSTAKYTRNGSLVTATFDITYPSTASGSNAVIGGLPFSGTANVGGLVTVYTSYSYLITGPVNSGTTINLYANAGSGSSQLTNVLLSSKRIMAVITYLV